MRKLFERGAGEDRGTTSAIPVRPDLRDEEVELDDSGGMVNGMNTFSGNNDNDASSSHGDTSRSNSHVLLNGNGVRSTRSSSTRTSLLLVKPLVLLDKVDTAGRKLQQQTFSRIRNYLCSYETEQEVLRRDAWFEKHTKRWYDNVEDADSGIKKEKLISHLRGEIYDSKVHYSIYDVFEPVTMASLAAPAGGGVLTAANGHSDLRSNASANPLGGGDGKQKHPRGAGGSLSSCSIGEKPPDETGTGVHRDSNNRDSSTFVPNRALSRLSMGASHLLAVFAAWSFILGTGLCVYRKYLSAREKRLLCQVDLAVDFAYFLLGPLLCLKTTVLNVLRGVEVMEAEMPSKRGPCFTPLTDLSWWGDVLSCCLWVTLYPDYCASFVFASRHYVAMLKLVRMWRLARDPIYMLLACRTWNVGRLGRLVLSILCYGHFCGCVWFYINDQERIVLRIIEQDTIFRSGDGDEVEGGHLLGTSVYVAGGSGAASIMDVVTTYHPPPQDQNLVETPADGAAAAALVPNISPERHLLQNSLLTFFDLYAYSLQHGMIMFLGRMNSTGNSAVENLLFAIIAPIGIIIQSIIFSKINMMFMARGQHIMRQQQLLVDLKASMKMLRLPLSLRSRILSYFTYQRVHRNQDFLGVLHNSGGGRQSLQLRWQLALTLYRDLLDPDVVGGFCLPTASFASLQAIVLALTDEICLPGDYICKEGDEGTGMYFLLKGELIVSAKGEVLAVLRKGQFFGDLSLLTGLKRTASVRATTFCTLAFLSKATMAPILMKYPDQMELMASVFRNTMRREMKESMDSRKHCVDPASFSNKERWVERELWQRCEEMESEEERRLRGENLNDDEGSSSSSGSEDPTSEDESASSSEVVDEDSDEKQSGVEDLRSEAEDLLAFRSYLEVEAGREQDPEHSSGDEVWDPNATTDEDDDSSVEQEKEEVQLDAGAKKEGAAESSPNKTSPSALKQSQLVLNPVSSSSTDSAPVVPADKKRANSREQHSAELQPSRQGSRKSSRKTSATVDSRAGLTITSPNKAHDGTDHEPVLTQSSSSKNHNHNYNGGEQHQSDAITPTLAGLNLMRGISAGAASSSCGAHSSKLGSSPGSSSVGGSIVGSSEGYIYNISGGLGCADVGGCSFEHGCNNGEGAAADDVESA
eukprot:g11973.t1